MTHDRFPREPLTPEEQALARRLAQLGPQAEPSPSLDARVLATARAATSGASPSARTRVRWPVVFGLAASMVLAVGIAWRLRPLPEPPVVVSPVATPAPDAAVRAIAAPPTGAQPPEAARAPLREMAPPRPPRAIETESAPSPVAAAPPAQPVPAPESPAPRESAVILDKTELPKSAAAALPPPPPAAPAAQAEAPQAAARKAATAVPEEENQALDAAAAADQAAGDEPEAEVPPATADSPEVRDAWLQRIRELAASGQTDAARASLREFIRRHPDAPLPDDLRALSR